MLRHPHTLHPSNRDFNLVEKLLDRSKIDTAMHLASLSARPQTGPKPSNPYTARAVLMALGIVVAGRGTISLANMVMTLWHMSRDQLARVGMSGYITPERITALTDDYDMYLAEYELFRARFDQLLATIDSSPHPRGRREKNSIRLARVRNLTHTQKAVLAKNESLFVRVVDLLTKASTIGARPEHWSGHVAVDETLVESFATKNGCGTKLNELGPADPDAAWYKDKKTDKWKIWHKVVVVVPAVSPYEYDMENLAIGIHFRRARGEDNVEAAAAAIEASWRTGWAPTPGSRPLAIADQGYTNTTMFLLRMRDLGYRVIASATQQAPKHEVRLPSGHRIVAGELLCPAGDHIDHVPLGWPPDERLVGENETIERINATEEIARYSAPTNGRPFLVTSGPHKGKVGVRVACPAAAGQVRCPLWPDSENLPESVPFAVNHPKTNKWPACKFANITVYLERKHVKHLDAMTRGSFLHSDWFNFNRSRNERVFSQIKATSQGSLDGRRIELMGRARAGLIITFAFAIQNVRIIEEWNRREEYATRKHVPARSPRYKHTPRDARRKAREKLVKNHRTRKGQHKK